jgi:hypothetical protein
VIYTIFSNVVVVLNELFRVLNFDIFTRRSDFVNINNPFDFTPNLENFSRSVIDTTNHQSFSIWNPLKAVKRFFFQSPGSTIDRSNDHGDQNGHTNGSTSNGVYLMDTEKTDSNGYLSEESNYSKKTTDSPQNPNNFESFRDRQNSPNKPLDKSFYGTHTCGNGIYRALFSHQ